MNRMKRISLILIVLVLGAGYCIADQMILDEGSISAYLITYDSIEARIESADLVVEAVLNGGPVNVLYEEDEFLSGHTMSDIEIIRVLKVDTENSVIKGSVINIYEPYAVVDRGLMKPGKVRIVYEDYTPIQKGSSYILFLSWMDKQSCYGISSLQEGKFNIDATDSLESAIENAKFKKLKDSVLYTYGQ